MTYSETEIRKRIQALLEQNEYLRLYDTLIVPGNKLSRQAMRAYDPNAPKVTATVTAWRNYLFEAFPNLRGEVETRQNATKAERDEWDRKAKLNQLHWEATNGPAWVSDGKRFCHALAFVEYLTSEAGYSVEQSGKGVVRFVRQADNVFIGPIRNKRINAALQYLALTNPPSPQEPSSEDEATRYDLDHLFGVKAE